MLTTFKTLYLCGFSSIIRSKKEGAFMGFIIGKFLSVMILAWSKIRHVFSMYIDYCDFALVTFIVWLGCRYGANFHNAIALCLGLACATALYMAFRSKVGFWIVSPIFSLFWTWAFMELLLKYFFQVNFSTLWYWIVAILVFAYNLYKHMFAIDRKYTMAEIEAERKGKKATTL